MMISRPLNLLSHPGRSLADRNGLSGHSPGQGWNWNWLVRKGAVQPVLSIGSAEALARTPKMARLEAVLFVAEGALSAKKLSQIATLADVRETLSLIDQLNAAYDAQQSAFRIERVAAGYQLLTLATLSPWLDRIHHRQARLKLSSPMMETLAVISYRQPCTRADVEAIRGVQSAEIIKQLMEKNLVRVTGEDQSLGRPYLYGTTRLFLETFGLTSLNDLPMADELRRVSLDQEKTSEVETVSAAEQSAA